MADRIGVYTLGIPVGTAATMFTGDLFRRWVRFSSYVSFVADECKDPISGILDLGFAKRASSYWGKLRGTTASRH